MSYRPKVKICGITRAEDIERALALGADYIGIILYEASPRAVPLAQVPELLGLIPEGKRVLVDVATPTDVLAEYRNLAFDFYQIHFDLDIAIASVAAWAGLVGRERLWMAPRVPPQEAYFPQIIMEFADTVLVDTYSKEKHGGTGKVGDWQRFLDWNALYQHKHWVLSGGLGPENIAEALETCAPEIVDLSSGVESEPGIKDHDRLQILFENIEKWMAERPPEPEGDDDD